MRIWQELKSNSGLYFFIFILVFIKKWEPGGHIDATWYAAIAKNIAQTGNFFRFTINPVFLPEVWDHFPLSYWVMGKMMQVFGHIDLVARFYFMVCSSVSYFLIFKIGEHLKGKAFGYSALISIALCLYFGKWSGGIKHDVPLVAGYLGVTYFFLRGLDRPWWFLGVAPFFAFGVFSKGPVMAGVLGGLGLWCLVTWQWRFVLKKGFWAALALMALLLCIPYLPQLRFHGGLDYYTLFAGAKRSFFTLSKDASDYLFYVKTIVAFQYHMAAIFLVAMYLFVSNRLNWTSSERRQLKLYLCMMVAVIVPFSLFDVKFSYYMMPAYPFYALFSAQAIFWLWTRFEWDWSKALSRLSVAAMMIFLTFPLKTTGDRPKNNLNIINVIKFDQQIASTPVYFLGHYNEDMSIFQEYKFYGNIDLIPTDKSGLDDVVRMNRAYVIIRRQDFPVVLDARTIDESECFLQTELSCAIPIGFQPRLKLPTRSWPHEVYP